MSIIAGFGECLLRLKSPGRERLLQSHHMEADVGGAELNVLASLSRFGHETSYISVLPDNALGDAAFDEARRHGVGVKYLTRTPGRMGLYFYEAGSNIRPAKVTYDRQGSSFANLDAGNFDWNEILDGVDWLHLTGITPSLGSGPAAAALAAARAAMALGVKVSLDVNYRAQLWTASGLNAASIMLPFLDATSLLFASARDSATCFGIDIRKPDAPEAEQFHQAADALLKRFPNLDTVISTFRSGDSADDNTLAAESEGRRGAASAGPFEVRRVVDRIGAGDAFVAGYIHARLEGMEPEDQLRFGLAASALKHSIPGDMNRVSIDEVKAAMSGGNGGRVSR